LESADRALAFAFPDCPDADDVSATEVIALAHGEDYDAVGPSGTSGFLRRARGGLVPVDEAVVLRLASGRGASGAIPGVLHHRAHVLAATCLSDAPAWVHEGLATYFETLRIGEHELIVGVPPFRFEYGASTSHYADGLSVVEIDRRALDDPGILERRDRF